MLPELCEAFFWAAISEAGNSDELILCSNSGSSSHVVVLMRASVIIALDGVYVQIFFKQLRKF